MVMQNEVEAAVKISLLAALGSTTNKLAKGQLDDLTVTTLRKSEEKAKFLVGERDRLLTERDSALQEAQMWRSELGKARGNAAILEAAVVRAEEKARV
ncbi:Pleckstrin homology (PH) domain-containing protein [Zea mays]|uniref:Pleckstrin homology (PH) domain-containing protein n=1 Tax=Zea mays TaxID=4577 RepID=A0A1D6HS15_MAIZE|nr:Pleckstrin homology (PH) domain-containing protein [Zea mays]